MNTENEDRRGKKNNQHLYVYKKKKTTTTTTKKDTKKKNKQQTHTRYIGVLCVRECLLHIETIGALLISVSQLN